MQSPNMQSTNGSGGGGVEHAAELLYLGGLTFKLGLEKGGFRSQHAAKDEGHFTRKAQRPSQEEENTDTHTLTPLCSVLLRRRDFCSSHGWSPSQVSFRVPLAAVGGEDGK